MRANRFYDVIRIVPVRVASFNNGHGQTRHTAACTAKCGFSNEYGNRPAANLAARTHRCT
ncbi:mobile element transfer protein [Streptomyces sp. NPDC057362]|uniref:mobile element transfer protein n=1 Tax=Streptomyces sp. NPDC057362 TaxID=3346106 RepID=UPI00363B6E6A